MKNFWGKWFISASSGCLGRLSILLLVGVIGVFGIKFILPNDDSWTKLIYPIYFFSLILMSYVFGDLHTILNWFSERRNTDLKVKEASIKELELKKELFELERKQLNSRATKGEKINKEGL